MRVLVTGGAGYIGSVAAHILLEKGYEVTVLDDLATGKRKLVPADARYVEGSILDKNAIQLGLGEADAVMHFAAKSLVGESVAKRSALSWFEAKPLFGWRVLLPRTKDALADLVLELEQLGATVTDVPTLSVEQPRTPQQMERAVHGLVSGRYEWIVFTSHNAVTAVWSKCQEYGLDARAFAGLKIATSGEGTADQIGRAHV